MVQMFKSAGRVLNNDTLDGYLNVLSNPASTPDQKLDAITNIQFIFASTDTLASVSTAQANRTVIAMTALLADPLFKDASVQTLSIIYNSSTYAPFSIDGSNSDALIQALVPYIGSSTEPLSSKWNDMDLAVWICDYAKTQIPVATFQKMIGAMEQPLGSLISPDSLWDLSSLFKQAVFACPSNLNQNYFDRLMEGFSSSLQLVTDMRQMQGSPEDIVMNLCDIMASSGNLAQSSTVPATIAAQIKLIDTGKLTDANRGYGVVGGLLGAWGLMVPDLFDQSDMQSIFRINSSDARQMVAVSPQWFPNVSGAKGDSTIGNDCIPMFNFAVRHPGEPALKTLFDDTNLTQWKYYSDALLDHLYKDRDKVTGKPMVIVILSKLNFNGAWINSGLGFYGLDKFDVRVIEPGNNDNLPIYAQKVSRQLAGSYLFQSVRTPVAFKEQLSLFNKAHPDSEPLQVSDETISTIMSLKEREELFIVINEAAYFIDMNNGKLELYKGAQFGLVYLGGHGSSDEVELKTKKNGGVAPLQTHPRLDLTDSKALMQFKPVLVQGHTDFVFDSCNGGALNAQGTDIALFVAQTLSERSFAADYAIKYINSITFRSTPYGPEVDQVIYNAGNASVYDYRNPNTVSWPIGEIIPSRTVLAYPNPFQQEVNINFVSNNALMGLQPPECEILNEAGQRVAMLNGWISGDSYKYNWDGSALPSGTYFANILDGQKILTTKLLKSP